MADDNQGALMRHSRSVFFRALLEREDAPERGSRFSLWSGWPRKILLFDPETTRDATQRFTFGWFRVCAWSDPRTLVALREGIVYANDLPKRDPKGYAALKKFEHRDSEATSSRHRTIELMSRDDFLDEVFRVLVLRERAVYCNINLPFDLTRSALSAGEGRHRNAGSFSLVLDEFRSNGRRRENPNFPRLLIRVLDNARAFIKFQTPRKVLPREAMFPQSAARKGKRAKGPIFPGYWLDLRTLAFALTGEKYSLARMGEAFEAAQRKHEAPTHDRIDERQIKYARQDVRAVQSLLERLRSEFDQHPISLDPTKAFSPATIAKSTLEAMGVERPRRQFASTPRELDAIAMLAYYGGRAECRIRRTVLPVVHVDFVSMYATSHTLQGLWPLLTARDIRAKNVTRTFRTLLRRLTLARCFSQQFWKLLSVFVELEPDEDILPVRAQYDPASPNINIGVNYFSMQGNATWYAAADVIASVLLTGRMPRIRRAWRVIGTGHQRSLRPLQLAEGVVLDPRDESLFKSVIQTRKRIKRDRYRSKAERERLDQALKIFASAGAYGVHVESHVEPVPLPQPVPVTVHGIRGPFSHPMDKPENMGPYFCPWLASLITAGARLMLAMLERCVTDLKGCYVFCDTDSMAIVATKHGGFFACENGPHRLPNARAVVRALTWRQVNAIVRRFAKLNPYARSAVPGSILEITDVNSAAQHRRRQIWVFAIAAKRYAFFLWKGRRDIEVLDGHASEHGLGHLLDPAAAADELPERRTRQWARGVWDYIIRDELGLRPRAPRFFRHLAVSRLTITTPNVARAVKGLNRGKQYPDHVKAMNFLLAAHVDRQQHPLKPTKVRPTRFQLVRPFTSRPNEWLGGPWVNVHTGRRHEVTTKYPAPPRAARLKTIADVVRDYRTHPETKSTDGNGVPCQRQTRGLLQRAHVTCLAPLYVGKEAPRIPEVEAGIVHDPSEALAIFEDPKHSPWQVDVLPQLKQCSTKELASAAHVSDRAIRLIKAGTILPRPIVRERLIAFLRERAT